MRADRFLAQHGYFESRAKAQAAIEAGLVTANGQRVIKCAQKLSLGMQIDAVAPFPWVSRAGLKLDHAVTEFGVNVRGCTALDIGASTGGFTDVLLTRGASHVTAIDVGTGQMHPRLKANPRVTLYENLDARTLAAEQLPAPPNIIVSDVSFISAMKALPIPLCLAAPKCQLITLVKPQFEVGTAAIGRGGIVRDVSAREDAVRAVSMWLDEQGWQVCGQCVSPIQGGSGNIEYLIHAVNR